MDVRVAQDDASPGGSTISATSEAGRVSRRASNGWRRESGRCRAQWARGVSELRIDVGPEYRVYFTATGTLGDYPACGRQQAYAIGGYQGGRAVGARSDGVAEMKKKTVTTRYDVAEHLRTPDEMAAYLEACLEEPGVARHLAHALRPSDIAERLGDECRVAVGLLQTRLEVGGHLVGCPEMLRHVVPSRGRLLLHLSYSVRPRANCTAVLISDDCVALAPARKQDDHRASPSCEVHAVTRPMSIRNSDTPWHHRRDIARISRRQAFDAGLDPRPASMPRTIARSPSEASSRLRVLRTSIDRRPIGYMPSRTVHEQLAGGHRHDAAS